MLLLLLLVVVLALGVAASPNLQPYERQQQCQTPKDYC
jgi:hypothetical protein